MSLWGFGQSFPRRRMSPELNRWFGGSFVQNENGSPKVLYHGTTAPEGFTVFRPSTFGTLGPGIYLAEDPKIAGDFALGIRAGETTPKLENSRVIPVFAKIENPLGYFRFPADVQKEVFNKFYKPYGAGDWGRASTEVAYAYKKKESGKLRTPQYSSEDTNAARDYNGTLYRAKMLYLMWVGELDLDLILQRPFDDANLSDPLINEFRERVPHDGVIGNRYDDNGRVLFREYVVLKPTQVKSVYNRGTWDDTNPDILHGLSRRSRGVW